MKKQTLLGILGTLILGALGSGLWELIKPGFSFLGSATLTVVSLGMDSIVNDIYTRVGRGNASATLVKGTTLLLLGTAITLYAWKILSGVMASCNSPESRKATVLKAFIFLLLGSYIMFGSFRHVYVASTRGYFDYLVRVTSPFLTNDQRLAIDSRLALVQSKGDYEKLVIELKSVANANNVIVADE